MRVSPVGSRSTKVKLPVRLWFVAALVCGGLGGAPLALALQVSKVEAVQAKQAAAQSAAQAEKLTAMQAPDYAATKYPIVLVHGIYGTSKYLSIFSYWHGIDTDLQAHGARVVSAKLSSMNDNTVRGAQLLQQIREVLVKTGAKKVNLIGHSQGGMTARYVAALHPELVASITTIGTPHKGTQLADAILYGPPTVRKFFTEFSELFGTSVSLGNGELLPQDATAMGQSLTLAGSARFNAMYPSAGLPAGTAPTCDTPSGAYSEVRNGYVHWLYSWTGDKASTNGLDVTDPLWIEGSKIINSHQGGANDGAVPVCSARFGRELGVFHWNHFDEVNQIMGLRDKQVEDPVLVIRMHANRLKQAGL